MALSRSSLSCWDDNVSAFAVDGTFDDCQRLVKLAFADKNLSSLISANSINLGRLLPQMACFVAASLWYFANQAVYAKDAPKVVEKKAEVKAAEPVAEKEEPKVVLKFKSIEDAQEFDKLFGDKQVSFIVIEGLHKYALQEQKNIEEIDKQIEEKFEFKMKQGKMYRLDRQKLEMLEVGDIPQQQASEQQ